MFDVSEQKTSLNIKTTIVVVSGFTLSTSTNGNLNSKLESFKLPCYLPVSVNII